MIPRIKAVIYAFLGIALCTSAIRQENYWLALGIAFFVTCAVVVSLLAIGQTRISWDERGITVQRMPKPAKFLPWSEIRKLKVDHLGYLVQGKHSSFRLKRESMPKELLVKIRSSLRENQA